jgi:hypothetical protein
MSFIRFGSAAVVAAGLGMAWLGTMPQRVDAGSADARRGAQQQCGCNFTENDGNCSAPAGRTCNQPKTRVAGVGIGSTITTHPCQGVQGCNNDASYHCQQP